MKTILTCFSDIVGGIWVICSLRYLMAFPMLTDRGRHCVRNLKTWISYEPKTSSVPQDQVKLCDQPSNLSPLMSPHRPYPYPYPYPYPNPMQLKSTLTITTLNITM